MTPRARGRVRAVRPSVATRSGALLGCAALALAGCSQAPADRTVAVTGTDSGCTPAQTKISAGVVEVAFTNRASEENEIYVLRPDGSIVGEREGVGPGTTADLTVELPAGEYVVQCKPGMTGDGIRTPITVTAAAGAAAPSAAADPKAAAALTTYRAYVAEQVDATIIRTEALQKALAAGDAAKARSLYAAGRVGWERVEPVAESFGDLDPRIDLREADLEEGQTWTGWHVVEKGLWTGAGAGTDAAATATTKALAPVGERLLADLRELRSRVPDARITATSMANGAKELLDEVATGKVTGEEEAFSHTDLVDVQANVDGARKVVDLLTPALAAKGSDLPAELTTRFADLQRVLDGHRTPGGARDTGFVGYDTVPEPQRRDLSAAVDALAEPVSHLASEVVA